jgi:hypothetical protein
LNVDDEEIAGAARRLDADALTLLAFRFKRDRICVAEKMKRLGDAFGKRLEAHEYDSPWWGAVVKPPHAVLTEEYDKAGDAGPDHPTRQAFATLIGFLHRQLG